MEFAFTEEQQLIQDSAKRMVDRDIQPVLNVHPANTMRLVDALIKENKRFDLLIIPGARHGFGSAGGYFSHMRWEFFAEHLLGDHQRGADILLKD